MTEPYEYRNKKSVMLDTCFIIHELIEQREKKLLEFCDENNVLTTSFNIEELKKVSKKLGHDKKKIKDFLNKAKIKIINVPVSLGEINKEKKYADDLSKKILAKVHDPSDAVLVVAAINSGSNILTRDKHHLFTTQLSQELKEYGLNVYNDISTYESQNS